MTLNRRDAAELHRRRTLTLVRPSASDSGPGTLAAAVNSAPVSTWAWAGMVVTAYLIFGAY